MSLSPRGENICFSEGFILTILLLLPEAGRTAAISIHMRNMHTGSVGTQMFPFNDPSEPKDSTHVSRACCWSPMFFSLKACQIRPPRFSCVSPELGRLQQAGRGSLSRGWLSPVPGFLVFLMRLAVGPEQWPPLWTCRSLLFLPTHSNPLPACHPLIASSSIQACVPYRTLGTNTCFPIS